MKKYKYLLIWCAIALILQNAIFIYIEKVKLNHNFAIKAVKVEKKSEGPAKNIVIPTNTSNIETSYDGRFISYYEGDILKIGNRINGSVNDIIPSNNMTVCYYKWLPEDDLMLLAEKTKDSCKNQYLILYSYDSKKNIKRELLDYNMKTVKIDLASKKESVEDAAFSTSTHVIYLKLLKAGGRSSIYTINVMNQLEKVKINSNLIGKILSLTGNSNLLYEDKVNSKIKNYDGNTVKDLSKNKNLTLLASDKNDKVYIGEIQNNLIDKIFIGDINTTIDKWQTLNLPKATSSKNIIITNDGKILIHIPMEGTICNLQNNSLTKYEGKYIDMCSSGIISIINNKTKVTPLK